MNIVVKFFCSTLLQDCPFKTSRGNKLLQDLSKITFGGFSV